LHGRESHWVGAREAAGEGVVWIPF
jgi:hypothetical protein